MISALPAATASLATFPVAGSEQRPWTRWWWLGSAVDEALLTRELEQLQAAGFGGVEICPIYGAQGAEARFVPFLSPHWVGLLGHTLREAARLGLGVDLTTGTGWPFGGPHVAEEHASRGHRIERAADGHGWTLAPTGPVQRVKRAAPGGEGWVVDPYNVSALEHYLQPFNTALAGLGPLRPRAHFHDSFEYYGATWTAGLPAAFRRDHGYDLHAELAAFAGEGPPERVAAVRHDYRATVAALHLAWIERWTAWAHAHGGRARNQAHGVPANLVDLYAAADIPETETFRDVEDALYPMAQFAASAARLGARPLASAEAFTWLGEHFCVTLAELKPAADFLFLAGINHLFYHGVPASPPSAPWPGWLFYASVHFGPAGGLWRDLPAFNAYIARVQSLLQAGRPAPDVLLYFPAHDYWQSAAGPDPLVHGTVPGRWMWGTPFHDTAMALWRRGTDYTAISDRWLANATVVSGGRIHVGGLDYAALLVPTLRSAAPATLQRWLVLAADGATVGLIGDFPTVAPGLAGLRGASTELAALAAGLGLGPAPAGAPRIVPHGRGRLIHGRDLAAVCAVAGIAADPLAAAGLTTLRRRRDDGGLDHWVVNRTATVVDTWIPPPADSAALLALDPLQGRCRGRLPQRADGHCAVRLEPGEGLFLRELARAPAVATVPEWSIVRPTDDAVLVAGSWTVQFIAGGPDLPAAFTSPGPGAWTGRGDAAADRFAGTARYHVECDFARDPGGAGWALDLGIVADSARVRLNGRDLGIWWCAPWRRPVGDALQRGRNVLEVEVTNVAANRIADLDRHQVPWKRFHEINFVNRDYQPFDASRWPVRPAGLLGPVRWVRLA
jgi:hypothetical protein